MLKTMMIQLVLLIRYSLRMKKKEKIGIQDFLLSLWTLRVSSIPWRKQFDICFIYTIANILHLSSSINILITIITYPNCYFFIFAQLFFVFKDPQYIIQCKSLL